MIRALLWESPTRNIALLRVNPLETCAPASFPSPPLRAPSPAPSEEDEYVDYVGSDAESDQTSSEEEADDFVGPQRSPREATHHDRSGVMSPLTAVASSQPSCP